MNESYDWEVYEMFRDQIESQIPILRENILLLEDKSSSKEALDMLFRAFHTYKSSSAYLYLTPLNELVSKTEIVLSSLREKKSVVEKSVTEWLLEVHAQILTYLEEMHENITDLSLLPKVLETRLQLTQAYINPKEKLKTLSILYMDKNRKRASKIVSFLEKYVKNISHSTEEDAQNSVYNLAPFDILIINQDIDNHQIIDFAQSNFPKLALIVIFDKINSVEEHKLIKKKITHSILNPLNAKSLYSELISIVKTYYSSVNIIVNHTKIDNFIQRLQPLSNTVFEISRICDDEESTIRELTGAVKIDPVLSANILKVANSPIYGSIGLKTIDQAVTKFGKRAIKALAMSDVYNSLGPVDLSPYGISEEVFTQVSMLRLSLMLKWYSKVSISDLSLLSSTAILSNIGQLLVSQELISSDQSAQFEELCKVFSITYSEEFLLNTSTTHVSSQILRYLKLPSDIVEVMEHSDNPFNSQPEITKLCVANHIVCTLITLQGDISKKVSPEIYALLDKFDLEHIPLEKALQSLNDL